MVKDRKNKLLTDVLIVGSAPLAGYLLMSAYYLGAESNLGLPPSLAEINILQSVTIGFLVVMVILVFYWMSEIFSRLVPTKSAIYIRLRRDIQVGIFIGSCIVFTSIQVSTGISSFWDFLLAVLIIWFLASVPFIARDIIVPYLKNRFEKNVDKRMRMTAADDMYISAKKYYASFFSNLSIIFVLIPVIIIYTITFNIGRDTTDPSKSREYIIINSEPKQIVLINYGNRWVTAQYDDGYPNMPAYRKDYRVVNKEDMGKNSFRLQYIDYLYVYN